MAAFEQAMDFEENSTKLEASIFIINSITFSLGVTLVAALSVLEPKASHRSGYHLVLCYNIPNNTGKEKVL